VAEKAPAVIPNLEADSDASVGAVNTQTAKKDQTAKFLKITGYEASDILGSNAERRTFVTKNGGKYELSPKGTRVRVLSGPNPPSSEEGDEG
jgi:hypothetical protein